MQMYQVTLYLLNAAPIRVVQVVRETKSCLFIAEGDRVLKYYKTSEQCRFCKTFTEAQQIALDHLKHLLKSAEERVATIKKGIEEIGGTKR